MKTDGRGTNPKDSVEYEKMRYWLEYDILEWEGEELNARLRFTVFRRLTDIVDEVLGETRKDEVPATIPAGFGRELYEISKKYVRLSRRSDDVRERITRILMGTRLIGRVKWHIGRSERNLRDYRSLYATRDQQNDLLEKGYYESIRKLSKADDLYLRRIRNLNELADTDPAVAEWLQEHRAGVGSTTDSDARFQAADRYYRGVLEKRGMEGYYRKAIAEKIRLLTMRLTGTVSIAEHPDRFGIAPELRADLAVGAISTADKLKDLRDRFDGNGDMKEIYSGIGQLMREIRLMDALIVG